jgi:predicted dehydrogenase
VGQPLTVGLVGCGAISDAYLSTFDRLAAVRVAAAADLDPARAARVAAAHPGITGSTVDDLLADDRIDLVLNLTTPAAHADVALAALAAGKHVYGEKPLTATLVEADTVLAAAERAGLRVGCAPDTVLGTGVQTARHAVDTGLIGTPVAATAFMMSPGHEGWHPDPEFYYRPGGGPLLDMGPYYLSALVHLLGPVTRVTGASSRARAERVIGSGPRAGTRFPVEVDTHVTGVLEHAGGALSTVVLSFDVPASRLPRIEVYGTEGSLSVTDPNAFDGPVELWRPADGTWASLAPAAGHPGASRGYGVADLAVALAAGRPHRASADLAYHVLDIMQSLLDAADSHTSVAVTSTCRRPDLVPLGTPPTAG